MENCTFNELLNLFCDHKKIVDFYEEFCKLLKYSEVDKSNLDFSKFYKSLRYFDQDNSQESLTESSDTFGNILFEIFNTINANYFVAEPVIDKGTKKLLDIPLLFDSVVLLHKILLKVFKREVPITSLFHYISRFLQLYPLHYENLSTEDEPSSGFLQQILRFFVCLLRNLVTCGISNEISDEILTSIFNSFPFSDKNALNVFVTHIVPSLFKVCEYTSQIVLLELMWTRILNCFENDFKECTEPNCFSLLCCFCDFTFKENRKVRSFDVYDDVIWKIIQFGVTHSNQINRKQAIYVFKIVLFWLKTENSMPSNLNNKIPLFSMKSTKDLIIWNDLITLFEIFEETQIHVIKPVLPKFSRIIEQSSNLHCDSSFVLHPSWITCVINRMILHESKFVRKQALSIAMNISFEDSLLHDLHWEEFIQVIIKGLNDQNMYCRTNENDNLSLFLTSEKISTFVRNYISAFKTESQKVSFLQYLLKLLAIESWCGVALLHVTLALSKLDNLPSWRKNDFRYIREIIQGSTKTHESVIRIAIEEWLLKSSILFIDWNSLYFEDIGYLLSIFKNFRRHTDTWKSIITKLKEILSTKSYDNLCVEKAQEFALNCMKEILSSPDGDQKFNDTDLEKIARLMVILGDSNVIKYDLNQIHLNWLCLLKPLTSVMMDAPQRPYMSEEKFYNLMKLYTLLVKISLGSTKDENDAHSSCLLSCLNATQEFAEYVYQKSLMDIKNIDNLKQFLILFEFTELLSSFGKFSDMYFKNIFNLLKNYDIIPQHFLSKKIMIVLFYEITTIKLCHNNNLSELQASPLKKLSFCFLSKILQENVMNDLLKSVFTSEVEKEKWLKFSVKLICKFWKAASYTIDLFSFTDHKEVATGLLQLAENMFDLGSKETYAVTIDCIKNIVPKLELENIHDIEKLLNAAYKGCLELHGCEAFRPTLNSLIEAVFQPFMLHEKCFDLLYKFIDCFRNLSENAHGIFYLVIRQFCNAFPLHDLYKAKFNYIPILIHSLTYGPIHHKGQRILEDSIAYISKIDDKFSQHLEDYNKPSIFVRVSVINYLLKSFSEDSSEISFESLSESSFESLTLNEKIAVEIINGLFSLDNSIRNSRSSKFSNSFNHRIRNRIWQTVLLLQSILTTGEEKVKLDEQALSLLEHENQQPSIRCLQEWLILLNIIDNDEYFLERFMYTLFSSLEKRPGFIVSLLSILIHLLNNDILPPYTLDRYVDRCFPVLITLCMAQNFAVRLYSRFALMKFFSFCTKNNWEEISKKYNFISDIFSLQHSEDKSMEKGNIHANLQKLQNDFYFSSFHPVNNFTLESIFYDLPRLSNMPSEEWIKPEYFIHQEFYITGFGMACFNRDDSLKNSCVTSWNEKIVNESPVSEANSFDYNFQKKICPAKYEIYDLDVDFLKENKAKQNGLIVIASLIDKIPNLGGLCRTCEVFGVEQFVIGSLKYTEDKMFQNLAVSSDKWVSIKEVKPYYLKEYLLSLKEEGYTLVGAEQTDDSYKLTDYAFPKKSALLLGHEKEGMPVDLIQLLDVCVEIPQQGIIRSLNVHVSGAIFIWEYARQQIVHV